jgi:N-methylhydantoinase A
MTHKADIRFAIDTGGTFTDIVVFDESAGTFSMDKALTTPHNTLEGVMAAITKAGIDLHEVQRFFVHGSTTALNALLERKGVRTAYLTTKGFRDVPEIMRFNRPEMYNPKYHKPPQIVPRNLRFEVTERMNSRGEVLVPLDEAELRSVARTLKRENITALAICFLHSFKNSAHERRAREVILEEFPQLSIALSSLVAAEHREFERGMTTILNAYLAPVVERWIGDLQKELKARAFGGEIVLTKSDGGGLTADSAKSSAINMLLSGPAGGVIGGAYMAALIEQPNLITMDVGGTSFDIAMIKKGEAAVQRETKVSGYPILISNLDIRTIGAGGGSLARIDTAGALQVGPQSAGAVPGPMCYARGGAQPTVTDALLINAFMDPRNFLGGTISLDVNAATHGITEQIARPLGLDLHRASSGILRIVMSNMAEAIKDIAAESGDDPRDFAMLCFGGGGPLFGAYLMDELSLPAAIIPILPAAFSAWGMLMIDLRHDVAQTIAQPLSRLSLDDLERQFVALEGQGKALLHKEGVPEERWELVRSADMRYLGQEHSVSVPIPAELGGLGSVTSLFEAFERVYAGVYGYRLGTPADVVTLRVKALGKIPAPKLRPLACGNGDPSKALIDTRPVHDFLEVEPRDFRVFDRARLHADDRIDGPALIIEPTTTTVVRQQHRCTVDRVGSLLITRR